MDIITAKDIKVAYGNKLILKGIDISVEEGKVTSVIGPNGCGKSTFLLTLTRNLRPREGTVKLMGNDIYSFSQKAFARGVAMLHQEHECPADLTVRELVSYGRFAYRSWWRKEETEDTNIIDQAIERTGLEAFADRQVSTLSGGERQRAWIAMLLSQKPKVLILDEPTTFLDIAHQLEVLELLVSLSREDHLTVIMVLHDINHAIRYSDTLVMLKEGRIYASGSPKDVLNGNSLRDVFGVESEILQKQDSGQEYYFPVSICR